MSPIISSPWRQLLQEQISLLSLGQKFRRYCSGGINAHEKGASGAFSYCGLVSTVVLELLVALALLLAGWARNKDEDDTGDGTSQGNGGTLHPPAHLHV